MVEPSIQLIDDIQTSDSFELAGKEEVAGMGCLKKTTQLDIKVFIREIKYIRRTVIKKAVPS